MESGFEPLRSWEQGDFSLQLFTNWQTDHYHKVTVGYEFSHAGKLIFTGTDYHCPHYDLTHSERLVEGILTFLSLQPGDGEDSCFKNYTPEQWDWLERHAEELACLGENA